MNKFKSYPQKLMMFTPLLLSVLVASCSDDNNGAAVTGPSVIIPGATCPLSVSPTIPTVTMSDPTSGNQVVTPSTNGVAGNGKLITATFSLAMNPATIDTSTFTLSPLGQAALVPVSVVYSATTNEATLMTAAPLLADTSYGVVITNAVTSDVGVSTGCGYAWNFKTAVAGNTGVEPVNLGLATPFGIATAAGITTTAAGGTVNGNLVLDPTYTCNAVPLPGCGGTAPVINGNTIFNSADATAVMADLLVAYNSILPANLPGATVLGCGTIGTGGDAGALTGCAGNATLPAGVYISATNSTIGVSGVLTLDGGGDSNAQFVFQAPSALTTAAGASGMPGSQIVLINGAKASNVWWQVGSSATIGTYADFQGNVLANTSITMGTDSTSCGRMLAGAVTATGLIALQGSTVSVPGNVNAPASCQ